ncbi:MAG: GNAT family N-acetyltransferase [Chloroflexota bacterium]
MSIIRTHALEHIFEPKRVAVIGASERPGSVGRSLMINLLNSPFDGEVIPVNLRRTKVMGIPAPSRIKELGHAVDLAIIATPAKTVARIVEECASADAKGAIIISAGFGETGRDGKQLEKRVLKAANQSRMRLIGPNCLGVMNPYKGLNATFAPHLARPGNVGLISQSGAILSAMLDWSIQENAGFSKVISIGAMLDVNWSDMIHYLGDDPHTRSIIIYMESMDGPRGFLSAARAVAQRKPIVLLKAGRNRQTAQAVSVHVGATPGDDLVMDAAFRRSGVLRVERTAELFYMAGVLSKQPRPKGANLVILTNAGGPGILAADALISGGGQLSSLSNETLGQLDALLPSYWSRSNPVDLLGEATPEHFAQALEIVAQDPDVHGILVVLTPQDMTDPTRTAEAIQEIVANIKKPVLATWMGGTDIAAGRGILNQAEIPTLNYPDSAARIFNYMWQHARTIQRLFETPIYIPASDKGRDDSLTATDIIGHAQTQQRGWLNSFECSMLLERYNIHTHPTILASSPDDAANAAQEMGFPVTVTLHSETLQTPGEVDGIWRNLTGVEAVRQAVRAIQATVSLHVGPEHYHGVIVQPQIRASSNRLKIGSHYDPQFGPILQLGDNHYETSKIHDYGILALPPLTSTLARHLIERTQRLRPLTLTESDAFSVETLEGLLVRFSRLVAEQRRIRSIDLEVSVEDSLLADSNSPKALTVLQSQVHLHDAILPDTELTRPAIRPYPGQYARSWTLRNGTQVTIRPIGPEDEPLMATFNQTLSEDTIYLRYFYPISVGQLTSHDRLARFCFIDYDLEMTLVVEQVSSSEPEGAEGENPGPTEEGTTDINGKDQTMSVEVSQRPHQRTNQIIAVGQLVRLHGLNEAEFALLVGDGYQQQGLGTELLRRLLVIARDEEIDAVVGSILPQNRGMRMICDKLGFTFSRELGGTALLARKEIGSGS